MKQFEKLEAAKKLTLARLDTSDFLQSGFYSFLSVEEVEGEEVVVEIKLIAKKNFDVDEALENFEFEKKEHEESLKKKEAKAAGKGKIQVFFFKYLVYLRTLRKKSTNCARFVPLLSSFYH